jgi:tetratricopeptide (TPR) repeat protein
MTADELDSIRSRIDALSDLNRHLEIIELARRGLAIAPEDGWLLGQLALSLSSSSDPRAAREVAERAVAAAPQDPWVHRVAAIVLLEAGKSKQARTHAERAAAIAPYDAYSHVVLAAAHHACGSVTKAAAAADEAIRLAPMSPAGFVERSRQALGSRRWSDAEQWARKALEIDATNSAALNNLAVARQQQGKHTEALDLFARAATAEPGDEIAAANARQAAGNLGGVALGGFACYLVLRVVILSFRGSPIAGIAVLVVLGVTLLVVNHVRFERNVTELPPHLQAFARDQRRIRWRDPSTWLGRNRRQRVGRAAVVVAIVAVLAFAWTEADDEPGGSSPPTTLDADYVDCLVRAEPGVICEELLGP